MDIRDDITFEVPDEAAAQQLCQLLESSACRVVPIDDVWSVWAPLGTDPTTVALLLRRVEAWVAERGLHAIRFELDGRWYVMESGEAIWALEAA